jgi:CheY-like chemotaxis protein
MRDTIAFCLIGFTGSEASAMQALIRLMMRRGQSCSLVREIAGADMVVANADDPETMRILWAQTVTARVLLIGADDGATGWTLLPRPMKLLAVLDTIDSLLSAPPSRRAELEPTPPAPVADPAGFEPTRPYSLGDSRHGGLGSPATGSGFPATQPFDPRTVHIAPSTRERIKAVPTPRQDNDIDAASIASWRRQQQARREGPASAYAESEPGDDNDSAVDSDFPEDRRAAAATPAPVSDFYIGTNDPHVATPPPAAFSAEALVIDAGEMSRRVLQNHLHRHGLRTDAVGSGEEALKQMPRRPYRYVFIDELAGGMAANDIARALRKLQPTKGPKLSIVLLSSRGGAFDKFRARLAGIDVYLVKPLMDDDFGRALGNRLD